MDPHDHEDPRRHWPERDQDAGRSGRQAEQWSRPGGDGHRTTPQGGQEHGFRRSSRQHDYTAEHHQGGGDYGSGADNEPTLYGSGASRAGYGGYGGGGSRGYGGTGGQAANGGYSGPGGGARGLGPPSGSGYGGYEGRHRTQEGPSQGRSEPDWDGRWGNPERSQQGDDYLREAATAAAAVSRDTATTAMSAAPAGAMHARAATPTRTISGGARNNCAGWTAITKAGAASATRSSRKISTPGAASAPRPAQAPRPPPRPHRRPARTGRSRRTSPDGR